MRSSTILGLAATVVAAGSTVPALAGEAADSVRVATFNTSLNRSNAGDLITDLSAPGDTQAAAVAEIIQRTQPDVVLINEFDYDAAGDAIAAFQANYLEVSQNGSEPAVYPYVYLAPSNTGIPSGFDLDNNGTIGGGGDAYGFGFFEGQFAMVLLSKHPIVTEDVRTFQNFLWVDMPDALLPIDPKTQKPWYSDEELEVVRLSSKSHWDVPIAIDTDGDGEGDGDIVHILCAHPTPPVFDGPEDRNGRRNHDEIRFWADYVDTSASGYIYDDAGLVGGLAAGSNFVIVGDYNADPKDGDSTEGAILQLLDHPMIVDPLPASLGGLDAAIRQNGADLDHLAPASQDTADFNPAGPGNLRVDYALPSAGLGVAATGIFWPSEGDDLYYLTGAGFPFVSSDHRMVWVDLDLDGPAAPAGPFPNDFRLDFIGEATFETGFMFEGSEVGGLSGWAYDPSIDAYRALSDDRSQFADARFYVLTADLSDGLLADGDVAFKEVLALRDEAGDVFPEFSLDPEGLAYSTTGELYIASEGDANNGIDPFVDVFTPIGRRIDSLPIPSKYLTGTPDFGIRNNLAFESLTLTPDESVLYTATENALFQDGPAASVDGGSPSRIMRFDLETGQPAEEFVYETDAILDPPNPPGAFATNGLVELLALSDDRLLALERSFAVGVGNGIRIYDISTEDADDVSGLDGLEDAGTVAPVSKELSLDLADLGITLDNVEGMTFGPVLPDGRQSLVLVSDNNFNPNGQFTQFLAFAIEGCPSDVDGDGEIGFSDLLTIVARFGTDDVEADVDADGAVDFDDLLSVLAAWGPCV